MDCRSWAASRDHRQGEAEDGAKGRPGFYPQAAVMGFNDRVADRQPHSHTLGLRRAEGIADALPVCGVKTNTRIRHADDDVVSIVELRPDHQDTRTIRDHAHRVDAVHDEIENDL